MSQPRPIQARNRRSPLLPRLLGAAVVIALIGGGVWYWQHRKSAEQESAFRTTAVERGNIRVAISATGTLSAISTVTVGSQISGQVTEVLVDFNDPVKKDQIVARIDPSTYQAQIRQGNASIDSARATLAQNEATLRNAQLDYDRKSDLAKQKLVAQSDVDLARSALDQARGAVNVSRALIVQQTATTQTTQLNLERTVIRSPVDGVVLTRSIEPGQTVAANFSAPELFTIAEDLSKMQILLGVDESDIGQVKSGQTVSFTVDAFSDRQFKGTVEQVRLSATTTNNVVTYPVVVTVDNSDGTLLPGLTVNAEIEVSRRDAVLKVSNAALRFKPAAAGTANAPAPAGAGGGSGVLDELGRTAAEMKLTPEQQAEFDQAGSKIRERQAARQAAQASGDNSGGNLLGGPGPGGPRVVAPGAGGGNVDAQMRQRMMERFQQDFAAFHASLDETQRKRWDAAMSELVGAKRAPLYKLVDGKPQQVIVQIGASDGTNTEISGGNVQQGDLIVTGERASK